MERKELEAPAMPESVQKEKKTKGFMDKLGILDDKAGQRIKDTADKVGVIGSIGAIVIGFLFWSRADDVVGFLIGLVLAGLGTFASFVLMSLLYSYGDIISISVEQSVILKRMEAKKIEELQKMNVSNQLQWPPDGSVMIDRSPAAKIKSVRF